MFSVRFLTLAALALSASAPAFAGPLLVAQPTGDACEANMRTRPDIRAPVVHHLHGCGPRPDTAVLLRRHGRWFYVSLDRRGKVMNGYIHSSQVLPADEYVVQAPDGHAKLRETPSLQGDVFKRMPNGEIITVMRNGGQGEWLPAWADGDASDYYGFVHQSQVVPADRYIVRTSEGHADLRSAPDAAAAVRKRMRNGEQITVVRSGGTGGWLKVWAEGAPGDDGETTHLGGYVRSNQVRPAH